MPSVSVSMPDEMKEWITQQGNNGKYKDASDYVRDLIRKDQERESRIIAIQKLVDEGMESGVSTKNMDEIFQIALARHQSSVNETV